MIELQITCSWQPQCFGLDNELSSRGGVILRPGNSTIDLSVLCHCNQQSVRWLFLFFSFYVLKFSDIMFQSSIFFTYPSQIHAFFFSHHAKFSWVLFCLFLPIYFLISPSKAHSFSCGISLIVLLCLLYFVPYFLFLCPFSVCLCRVPWLLSCCVFLFFFFWHPSNLSQNTN